jgi:hypothetical protein
MKTLLKTFAVLVALASLPLAASADTTTPDKAAPPMTGTGDMMGMMGSGAMKMDGMQMDGMMGQMMQMMQMMEMMQMARMMTDCTKMMADMSMMGKGADPMMNAPATPAPKG